MEQLSPEQFVVIALESARELGWNIGHTDETGFLAYTRISFSSFGEQVTVKISGDTAILKSECAGNQLMDWGKNKKNIEHFIMVFERMKGAFSPEELATKLEDLRLAGSAGTNAVATGESAVIDPLPAPSRERARGFFFIFKPVRGYFVTPILIDLNILIFLAMVFSGVSVLLPDNESLIKWGANFRPITLEGEWWRLITNLFLHIGILHLLMNMYALLFIGLLLEPYLGKARFIAAYLMTGIAASMSSLWWHDLTISAGASGAIFGMYGVFLAMLTTNLIEASARKAFLTSILIFVGYNLFNGMKGGVDNAAHIGGLTSGLIIGYAFYPGLKKPGTDRSLYLTIGLLTILVIALSFVFYQRIPNDLGKYDEEMKVFFSNEAHAMASLKIPDSESKESKLNAIKKGGLLLWNDNVRILSDLDKLNLPATLHERDKILMRYCNLRIQSFKLVYSSIYEDTDRYLGQLEDYNKQIEATISDLKAQVGK